MVLNKIFDHSDFSKGERMSAYNSVRNLDRWGGSIIYYSALDDFMSDENLKNGIYSINLNGLIIDFNVRLGPIGNPVAYSFHGAVKRDGMKLPYFSGGGVVPSSCTLVMFSDPALYIAEDLTLAWFMGLKVVKLQEILILIIEKINSYVGASKIIFFGGSGGGFASLFYGSRFKDSLVIASNPQTNILNYYKSHVDRYLNYFQCNREDLGYFVQYDLCQIYKEKSEFNIFYMQNTSDYMHVEKHCKPFLKAVGIDYNENGIVSNRVFLDTHQYGVGHKSRPASHWGEIIKFFCNFNGDYGDVFESKEFKEFINFFKDKSFEKEKNLYFATENDLNIFVLMKELNNQDKPNHEDFKRFFKIAKDKGLMIEEVDEIFSKSLICYPNGWSIKYHYAVCISEYGFYEKSISLLMDVKNRLGDDTPCLVNEMINKIQSKFIDSVNILK